MEIYVIVILCLTSFIAGCVDAIIGGGGLIQTPIALILLPEYSVASIIGSLKIPACSGTSWAALHYTKRVPMNLKLLLVMALVAFVFAFMGSWVLTLVGNSFIKPIIFFVLLGIAFITFTQKEFGQSQQEQRIQQHSVVKMLLMCMAIGFYDGFIGPGTGSFLVLGFIWVLGFDFLHASAHAKVVNLVTNFGSICLFLWKGTILWKIALPMAVCNAIGGYLGATIALKKGNSFLRMAFLAVVFLALMRFGYDLFFHA